MRRLFAWMTCFFLAAIVSSCSVSQEESQFISFFVQDSEITLTPFQPNDATPTPLSTATSQVTETPISTATAMMTPTEVGCEEKKGQLIESEIQPENFNGPLEFILYLPPCYAENAPKNGYPLLTLLHGQTYTPQQWIDIGLPEKMDQLINSGEIPPFVVVMPYESIDYSIGFHNAIIKDLIPYLQDTYLLCEGRDCQAIGGISRGGGWALTAVFKNPGEFSSLGLHSTPVSDSHLELIRYGAASAGLENLPRIYLDYGSGDYWASSEKTLVDTFDQIGISFTDMHNTGAHDNAYWEAHLLEYLRWYAAGWK